MNLQFKTRQLAAFVSAGLLALAGCSGEDGAAGAAGTSCSVTDNGNGTSTVACTDGTTATIANGANGTNGQSCAMTSNPDGTRTITCPDGGVVVLPAVSVAGNVNVTDEAVAIDGADVVITFKVKVDGVDNTAFTDKVTARRHWFDASVNGYRRDTIAADTYTVAVSGGTYTVRITNMATTMGATPSTFLVSLDTGPEAPVATAIAHSANGPSKAATPSDQACMNCHGDVVFRGGHHGANPEGVGACVVCHVRVDTAETRLGTATNLTTGVAGTAPNTRLMGYVHGIHNSHNMADGVYSRNGSTSATSQFSIGFPSYMNNCSTCHDNDASLENVLSKPVSFQTCMSCHDGWEGFGVANTGTPTAPIYLLGGMNHASYNASTNCGQCHGGGIASTSTVRDFHGKRQVYTPRNGLLYDGKDQSIEKGKNVRMEITGTTPVAATTATVSTITQFSRTGTVVTVTTAADHNLATGDYVEISAAAGTTAFAGGSGAFKYVTVTSPTEFTYSESGTATTEAGAARTVKALGTFLVTWKAYDTKGTADVADDTEYNPCNADIDAGPVFMDVNAAVAATGLSTSNMSLLQAYAQGNDWVNAGIGSSPGQPVASPTLRTVAFTSSGVVQHANTACAANVATSTIAAAPTSATKGVLALQGKPQVRFTSGAYTRVIQVRSPSPTREFVVATGAAPAAADARRAIVDTASCLKCHQGSLYQHGGNRVDSVDLCVMCHNPASNEKNNRVAVGVVASEAYDGKAGETYDFRYMLHAIHSAGATNAPLIYYRGMGIYAFGSQQAIDALPNWPGAGTFPIFGSDTNVDGTPRTATNRVHNEIVVHYPRALNDCAACHVSSNLTLPSTLSAVAVTTDAGGTSYGVQTDDVLISPATASCMGCHQSGDVAMQLALRSHAYQNSWSPQAFTSGRADVLGGSFGESCLLCHGPGSTADFNAAHAGPGAAH